MNKSVICIITRYYPLLLKFYQFGPANEGLYYQSQLRVRKGRTSNSKLVYVVIGSNIINWDDPQYILDNVDFVGWLRPVYGGYAYCNNQVAFASYGCYDNIFFHYTSGFTFPSTCPIGHPNYIDYSSKNIPNS